MTRLLSPKSSKKQAFFYLHDDYRRVPRPLGFFHPVVAVLVLSKIRFLEDRVLSSQIEENSQQAKKKWCTSVVARVDRKWPNGLFEHPSNSLSNGVIGRTVGFWGPGSNPHHPPMNAKLLRLSPDRCRTRKNTLPGIPKK